MLSPYQFAGDRWLSILPIPFLWRPNILALHSSIAIISPTSWRPNLSPIWCLCHIQSPVLHSLMLLLFHPMARFYHTQSRISLRLFCKITSGKTTFSVWLSSCADKSTHNREAAKNLWSINKKTKDANIGIRPSSMIKERKKKRRCYEGKLPSSLIEEWRQ